VPAALYSPRRLLVLISVRSLFDLKAIVWLEGLAWLKIPMTSSGIEVVTFRLVALGWRKRSRMALKPIERWIIMTFRWWDWAKVTTHFRTAVAHEVESRADYTVYIKRKTFYDLRVVSAIFWSFSIKIRKNCMLVWVDISQSVQTLSNQYKKL
jgi:hypothetical protein